MTFAPAGTSPICRLAAIGLFTLLCICPAGGSDLARTSVWKVTSGDKTLYLAGSVHALRGVDYPLPAAYEQAFQASSTLAFETEVGKGSPVMLLGKAAFLPSSTTLRDHLDPRVYDYIKKVIANVHAGSATPEKNIEHLKPWALAWMVHNPSSVDGVSGSNGVESYMAHKATLAHKPMVGMVPLAEHVAVFSGMSDADSQAYLLYTFIALNQRDQNYLRVVNDWKQGNIDDVDRLTQEEFRDLPGLKRRILTDRNHRWLPEIVRWLQSGKTYLVVAGTAHMAGSEGLPALLRAQGFQVEQL